MKKMVYVVKIMNNREEGYKVIKTLDTEEQAREYTKYVKGYIQPIDIYYTIGFKK